MSDFQLWKDADWKERVQISICAVVAVFIALGMFGLGLYVIAASIDGITITKSEHDRCLKQATNGYEIRECGR